MPIKLFPLDVTLKVPLTKNDVDEIARSQNPLASFLAAELGTWFEFVKRDTTHMHDPLTVAALLEPGIVTRSLDMALKVECRGEHTLGAVVPYGAAPDKNVEVALQIDAERFHGLFMGRLLGRGPGQTSPVAAS